MTSQIFIDSYIWYQIWQPWASDYNKTLNFQFKSDKSYKVVSHKDMRMNT